jgi:4-carboxymuconolactone decarboxylase
MARLRYPDPTELSSTTQQVLAQLPVQLHLFQMLAHAQSALTPTLLLGKAILGEQKLAAHFRELAILQVAKQAEANYEWVQHVPIAKAAGVTDEQIALVEQNRLDDPALDPCTRLVLRTAQEIVARPKLSEETFATLQACFSPREIVELLLSISYYLMLGRIMTTLQIDLDHPSGNTIAEAAKQGLPPTLKATQEAISEPASKEKETMLAASFQALQHRFQPREAAGLDVTIQVIIEGTDSAWSLRITNGTCELNNGTLQDPNSTITLNEADWLAFVEGNLNPVDAFLAGRISVTGDLLLATRLQSLFSR